MTDARVIVSIGEHPSQLLVQVEADGKRYDLHAGQVSLDLFDQGNRMRWANLRLPCTVEVVEP